MKEFVLVGTVDRHLCVLTVSMLSVCVAAGVRGPVRMREFIEPTLAPQDGVSAHMDWA